MKLKLIGTIMFALITLLVFQPLIGNNQNRVVEKNLLTNEQLSLIEGKGCGFFAWLAAVAADVACAVAPNPWGCLAAVGTTLDCITQIESGATPPTPPSSGDCMCNGPIKPKGIQ